MSEDSGYFDTTPKKIKSQYYDYNDNLANLTSLLSGGNRLVLITGVKRLGKSSLVQVGLSEAKLPYVLIDSRPKPGSVIEFLTRAQNQINESAARDPSIATEVVRRLADGQKIQPAEEQIRIRLNTTEDLLSFLNTLDKVVQEREQKFILAMDEAQLLGHVDGLNIDQLLSSIYEDMRSITLLLTGSEVGLLYDFLPRPYLAPLALTRYELKPLTLEQAREFLTLGFSQSKLGKPPDNSFVARAFETLGGNIGWLTNLGFKVITEGKFEPSMIEELLQEKVVTPATELNEFLDLPLHQSSYELYLAILHRLYGPAPRSELERAVQSAASRSIRKEEVEGLLRSLVRSGFVVLDEHGDYAVPDPVLREALKPQWSDLIPRPPAPRDAFGSFQSENSFDISNLSEKFASYWSAPTEMRIAAWIKQFPDARSWSWALRLLKKGSDYYYGPDRITESLQRLHKLIPEDEKGKAYVTFLGPPYKRELRLAADYYQAVGLKKAEDAEKISNLETILRTERDISSIVFLSDVIGSGRQVLKYYNMLVSPTNSGEIAFLGDMSDRLRSIKKYCFAVVGTDDGINRIRESGIFARVEASDVLTQQDRAFSNQRSGIFESEEECEEAKKLTERFGSQLYPRDESKPAEDSPGPLGFGGSELLVVFYFNTPNNTLPILWKEGIVDGKKWYPVLKRLE